MTSIRKLFHHSLSFHHISKYPFQSSISDYLRLRRHMGTWALSRLSTVTAGRVQPVLDIDFVLKHLDMYEDSIAKRKLEPKPNVASLPSLYAEAVALRDARDKAQKVREENSTEVARIIRERNLDKDPSPEVLALKEKGKALRDELRASILEFNRVNDQIIDLVISLPNILDPTTPVDSNKLLKTVPVPSDVTPWATPSDLEWTIVPGVGPSAEFPRSKATLLEFDLSGRAQRFLLENKFTETGNVDFVESSLFDVSGVDPHQFIRIREPNINPSVESHASYLVGGASFPAFLALFAQSLVKNPDEVMPIRYFVIGRSYGKKKYDNVMYQRSAVQVFIACRTEEQMNQEFDHLTNLTGDFLSNRIGTPYTTKLVSAPSLQSYEKRQIVFQTNANANMDANSSSSSSAETVQKGKEIEKTISSVSAVGDHVSKRLLCCYAGSSTKHAKFMHLVTGRFLNLTDFIRPPESPPQPHSSKPGTTPPSPFINHLHPNSNSKNWNQQKLNSTSTSTSASSSKHKKSSDHNNNNSSTS